MHMIFRKLLILAAAAALSVQVFAASGAESPFHGKYDVRYKYGVINTKVATASYDWDASTWEKKDAYYTKVTIKTRPLFNLFLGSDYFLELYNSAEGLSPLYFHYYFSDVDFKYRYRKAKGITDCTITHKGKPEEHRTFTMDSMTMDIIALLNHIRFCDFNALKSPRDYNVLLSGQVFRARVSYRGIDKKKFSGKNAVCVRFELPEAGLMADGSGHEFLVWFSEGPEREVLGLEANLGKAYLTCFIKQ